jgi:hypothetical protein
MSAPIKESDMTMRAKRRSTIARMAKWIRARARDRARLVAWLDSLHLSDAEYHH